MGEIWHNAIPWLRGDEFDAVMNYPLDSHDTKRLRSDTKNLDQYFAQLAVLFERYHTADQRNFNQKNRRQWR